MDPLTLLLIALGLSAADRIIEDLGQRLRQDLLDPSARDELIRRLRRLGQPPPRAALPAISDDERRVCEVYECRDDFYETSRSLQVPLIAPQVLPLLEHDPVEWTIKRDDPRHWWLRFDASVPEFRVYFGLEDDYGDAFVDLTEAANQDIHIDGHHLASLDPILWILQRPDVQDLAVQYAADDPSQSIGERMDLYELLHDTIAAEIGYGEVEALPHWAPLSVWDNNPPLQDGEWIDFIDIGPDGWAWNPAAEAWLEFEREERAREWSAWFHPDHVRRYRDEFERKMNERAKTWKPTHARLSEVTRRPVEWLMATPPGDTWSPGVDAVASGYSAHDWFGAVYGRIPLPTFRITADGRWMFANQDIEYPLIVTREEALAIEDANT